MLTGRRFTSRMNSILPRQHDGNTPDAYTEATQIDDAIYFQFSEESPNTALVVLPSRTGTSRGLRNQESSSTHKKQQRTTHGRNCRRLKENTRLHRNCAPSRKLYVMNSPGTINLDARDFMMIPNAHAQDVGAILVAGVFLWKCDSDESNGLSVAQNGAGEISLRIDNTAITVSNLVGSLGFLLVS